MFGDKITVAEHKKLMDAKQLEIDAANARVNELQKEVDTLKSECQTAAQKITDLENTVTSKDAEISSLKTKLSKFSAENTDLNKGQEEEGSGASANEFLSEIDIELAELKKKVQ
jgi:chromosome segregation ATPase